MDQLVTYVEKTVILILSYPLPPGQRLGCSVFLGGATSY
jgi:hypothetical protein